MEEPCRVFPEARRSRENVREAASFWAPPLSGCRSDGGGEVTPFVLNANAKSCEELLYLIGRAGYPAGRDLCGREVAFCVFSLFPQHPGDKFLAQTFYFLV